MNIPFGSEKIAVGEGIYSRPQIRVNVAYHAWRQDNPNSTPHDFLQKNCKKLGAEGIQITKWQCEDNEGRYIVKMTDWSK